MDPLLGEFANVVEHKPTATQIREYVRVGNHTRLVSLCIEQILLYMNEQEDWDKTYIESLPEYKAILYHYEHTTEETEALLWLFV